MFNKFYLGITGNRNILGGSLRGSLDKISRFLLMGPRIVRQLISRRLWSSLGWPERKDSCPSYASGGPAQGKHSSCGSPHTQASHPNVFGRGLTPSRRSHW